MTIFVAEFCAYNACGNTHQAPSWTRVFRSKEKMLAVGKEEAFKWVGDEGRWWEQSEHRPGDGMAGMSHEKFRKHVSERYRCVQLFWHEREVE